VVGFFPIIIAVINLRHVKLTSGGDFSDNRTVGPADFLADRLGFFDVSFVLGILIENCGP
jgi:hypothetical protein